MDFETRMKQRLKERLCRSFIVKEEPVGYYGDDKIQVRGDLILYPTEELLEQGFPNRFMIVEIKDDTTKCFQKSELIRQSIFLALAKFEGRLPLSTFIVTKNNCDKIFNMEERNVLQQFNIGYILNFGVASEPKKLNFKMGTNNILIDNNNYELIFNNKCLQTKFNLTVGTKARSNRISLL